MLDTTFDDLPQMLDLMIGEMFDPDEEILACAHANELIQLDLNGCTVPVLGVLNEKDHQKRYDGSAGVDDQLPRIGKMKQGARHGPSQHGEKRQHEHSGATGCASHGVGGLAERTMNGGNFAVGVCHGIHSGCRWIDAKQDGSPYRRGRPVVGTCRRGTCVMNVRPEKAVPGTTGNS